jgi:hypothetical protein
MYPISDELSHYEEIKKSDPSKMKIVGCPCKGI